MFKALIAVVALAAPAALATAQTGNSSPTGQWVLEAAPGGCIVHAATPNGTVLSVWGSTGQKDLSFLVQNKAWSSFEDGGRYDIQVSFDDQQAWPMEATAKLNLDADGPGLTFAVSPAPQAGQRASFIEQFANAEGMHIARAGQRIDTLSLSDTGAAMTALARCLSHVWSAGTTASDTSEGAVAVPVSGDASAI